MKTQKNDRPPLEEQAALAVRLGRELSAMALAVYAGGTASDYVFVKRIVLRLAEREPFEPRDDASLEALRGLLEKDLGREAVGTESVFVATRHDAAGEHGEVRDVPIYSERGQALLQIVETYERFIAARDTTLDRLAAERTVLRLLRE